MLYVLVYDERLMLVLVPLYLVQILALEIIVLVEDEDEPTIPPVPHVVEADEVVLVLVNAHDESELSSNELIDDHIALILDDDEVELVVADIGVPLCVVEVVVVDELH